MRRVRQKGNNMPRKSDQKTTQHVVVPSVALEDLAFVGFTSSAVSAAAYDPSARLLYISYARGAVYVYHDAPPQYFAQMLARESAGESIGQYIHEVIAPSGMAYQRLDGFEPTYIARNGEQR